MLGRGAPAMAPGKTAVLVFLASALCPAISRAQAIGDLVGSEASVTGSVVLAAGGTRVMSGTSITARDTAAALKLVRGGELRICPHSNVSLTASKGGRDLDIGMGTGAVEMHYTLASSADTILTPDFRVLLPGPGIFHFAIASDVRGNMCVRSLPGNSASLIVTEALGDGVYQVRAGDQIVFHNGRVSETDSLVPPDCGCGAPKTPVESAANTPAPAGNTSASQSGSPLLLTLPAPPAATQAPPEESAVTVAIAPAPQPVTRPGPQLGSIPGADPESAQPASQPPLKAETHIQIDAPFVFRAEDEAPAPPMIATLSLSDLPGIFIPPEEAQPPSAVVTAQPSPAPPKHGILGRVGSFFAGIFGRHH
jgi:hypothetical protein